MAGTPTTLRFTTPKGAVVLLDATGISTTLQVIQNGTSHVFTLAYFAPKDGGLVLTTTTGATIDVGPEDANEVSVLLAANAPRQKQASTARTFFIVVMAILAVFVLIIMIGLAAGPDQKVATADPSTTASAAPEPAPAAPTVVYTDAERTAQTRDYLSKIVAAASVCDTYGRRIADAAEASNLYTMYDAASAGEEACFDVDDKLDALAAPAFLDAEATKALKDYTKGLGDGYSMKAIAFGRFAEIADGNLKPSAVSAAKSSIENAQAKIGISMAVIMALFQEEGVKVEDMSIEGM